ncbi:hypothetical protein [Deinococcus sp.]|nr:hypothetical protein [Deinococcus sp.]
MERLVNFWHVSKACIRRRLSRLPGDLMNELDERLRGHLGL